MRMRSLAVLFGLSLVFGTAASALAIPLSIAGAASGADNETADTATGYATAAAADAFGSATAEISVASGRLRVHASSSETTPDISPHASALVSGWDRFTINGLPQGTIVDLVVILEITGRLERSELVPQYDANSVADVIFDVRRADRAVVPTVPAFQTYVSALRPDTLEVDEVFTVQYRQLAGPLSAFGLSFYAHANANGISTSDFSHTAVLSFGGLPQGASISSDAGFFQVPEPSLIALLAMSGLARRLLTAAPAARRGSDAQS